MATADSLFVLQVLAARLMSRRSSDSENPREPSMGGMDKTRLTKNVYHHGGVRGHFDC